MLMSIFLLLKLSPIVTFLPKHLVFDLGDQKQINKSCQGVVTAYVLYNACHKVMISFLSLQQFIFQTINTLRNNLKCIVLVIHISDNEEVEALLQLKLDKSETVLLGTTANGFIVWLLGGERKRLDSVCLDDWDVAQGERSECLNAIVLQLPHGIRNISTRMLRSNSVMLSANRDFAVAGVR